jgi:predicted TIM-barrel fold metal-dependent hydrolase
VEIEEGQYIGVDRIMFATDFPSIENECANSRPIIDRIYADIPEADKRRIWAGNAVEFFHLAN